VPAKPSLTINRRLNAPRAKVYAAWTDPSLLSGWFGYPQIRKAHTELDVRAGGRYRIVMFGEDGAPLELSGVYREVVPNEKLVFTWAWGGTPDRESLVSVQLRDDGAGTLLTLMHEQFFDDAARDRHNAGWMRSLENLVQFFDGKE